MKTWFDVDRKGLAALQLRRSKSFVIAELIQNAWDQNVTEVNVVLRKLPGRPQVQLIVTDDDPDGFSDLSHAFTLFADTSKRSNPEQRGRFNLGEKLVLSVCISAVISTTTGTITFSEAGRMSSKSGRARGSEFSGVLRMNQKEFDEATALIRSLIPPAGIQTRFNGEVLEHRKPLAIIEESLTTEQSDDSGVLRRVMRRSKIEFHNPLPNEVGTIYEMGIPIVETGDDYHINVMQKVPLTLERDNVPPAYLRRLRVLTLNTMHDRINAEQANSDWARTASSDKNCSDNAIKSILTKRFGEKRVSFDPSDPEANKLAVSHGYTVVYGSQMNRQEWENARRAAAILPAGQVTPAKLKFNDTAPALSEDQLTDGMRAVREYAINLARKLMDVKLDVVFLNADPCSLRATYSKINSTGCLTFYVRTLKIRWFDLESNIERIDALLIHEFAHHYSSDHLSCEYHSACCRLGAKLKSLALSNPQFFRRRS